MFFSKKLKKFKCINHCFFSKKGGYSGGIYKSLNCGQGSKDSRKNINKNLVIISKKMKISSKKLVLMYQTHSNKVIVINNKNKNFTKFNSDAIVTRLKGIALGVVTADCVPIILFDKKNKIIGCIHAGWKGAFSNIIKNTINKIRKLNSGNRIYASIGPCIGKKNYEVDINFFNKFVSKSQKNKRYFQNKNLVKKIFDLRGFVKDKLLEHKVVVDHVNYDTFKDRNNFFSYRRSQKLQENDYGRCISAISLI